MLNNSFKKTLVIITLLTIIFTSFSCSSKSNISTEQPNTSSKQQETNPLIGKWKYIGDWDKGYFLDHSDLNKVYEFLSDGKLISSGKEIGPGLGSYKIIDENRVAIDAYGSGHFTVYSYIIDKDQLTLIYSDDYKSIYYKVK